MSSTFGSLNIGQTGLTAQKLGLDTTGQNIANASTPGYHRETVVMQAQAGSTQPAIWATNDGTGNGVSAQTPTRTTDAFLQQRMLQQNAQNSLLTGKSTVLTQVEDILGEPGNTGLQSAMSTFSSDWSNVASSPNPQDSSQRTDLLSQAQTLAGQFNNTSNAIGALWTSSQQELSTIAQTATTDAQNIAKLNGQIQAAITAGGDASDLEDQRDTLVKTMAQQLGTTSTPMPDGTVNVSIGGLMLVSGTLARSMAVTGSTSAGTPLVANTVNFVFNDVTPNAVLNASVGGKAGALLDAVNTTLPSYSAQLDTVATTLMTAYNNQQAAGYDQYGNSGQPIFSGTNAGNMTAVMTDPKQVAASSIAPTAGVPSNDTTNALDAAQLSQAAGSAELTYSNMVVNLGVASASAKAQATTQQTVTTNAEAALDSSVGVSIDEESINLIKYQTAYSASAKYISTIDETLQDLLGMLG
jgi:flagellar hook-associated protein 1 FlgK